MFKKIIAAAAAAALFMSSAVAADLDLSSMSFDELVALRDQLNIAIWNSQEWQEVTVPAGVWEVGADIPAGHWTIRCAGDHDISSAIYCDKLDEFGQGPGKGWRGWNSMMTGTGVSNPGVTSVDLEMAEGMYFICRTPMIFTPYAGKPDLGFH